MLRSIVRSFSPAEPPSAFLGAPAGEITVRPASPTDSRSQAGPGAFGAPNVNFPLGRQFRLLIVPALSPKGVSLMSQHRSLKGASTIVAKRNVLKRFERVELLKQRGQFKAGQKVVGLPKTKPNE